MIRVRLKSLKNFSNRKLATVYAGASEMTI